MREIKLIVGVDISKDDFHVCIKERAIDNSVRIKGSTKFANTGKGFIELLEWVSKRINTDCTVHYIMEATGSYYENLAYFL